MELTCEIIIEQWKGYTYIMELVGKIIVLLLKDETNTVNLFSVITF
jgi:hypothetical protein